MAEQNDVKNKNFINASILIILIAAIVFFIFKNFDTSRSIILSFVGLGVVIFIHELGHFAAGKMCGIKVEAFAIGFGTILFAVKKMDNFLQLRILPTILEKENDPDKTGLLCTKIPMRCKPGETEYQLRIFPLGGFVKLMGQEDLGADKKSDDPRAFTNVAIWKKIVAVSAGVTLNVVLAAVLFIFIFMKGINLSPAVVGDVIPGKPAALAGLKPGDEILAVNGVNNIDFIGVSFAAALTEKNEAVRMQVKRLDGSITEVNIVPTLIEEMGVKGFGIEQPATLEIAKIKDTKSLEKLGLKAGDVLSTVNGNRVNYFWEFKNIIENTFEPNLVFSFKRQGQDKLIDKNFTLYYTSAIVYQDNGPFVPSNVYGLVPRVKVAVVEKDKLSFIRRIIAKFKGQTIPDANTGLKADDIIVQVGQIANPTYKELREATITNAGRSLNFTVLRDGKLVEAVVMPRKERDGRIVLGILAAADYDSTVVASIADSNSFAPAIKVPRGTEISSIEGVEVKNYYQIAQVLNANRGKNVKIVYKDVLDDENITYTVPANAGVTVEQMLTDIPAFKKMEKLYRASGPANALMMGSRKTLEFVGQTYMTLRGLITRDISTKSLMGPVGMIAASSKIIAERDYMQYLYFMGMISACLAVMNFLPLPIFDGGLVVLLIIEKIIGRPVHEKVQEVLVYIGLVLILGLVVLVTYNDIVRLIFG
ncbi:MAG: site-2 protease family protein [Phycisphaerales bacterium]